MAGQPIASPAGVVDVIPRGFSSAVMVKTILVGGVGGNLGCDVFPDSAGYTISVREQRAEVIVERLEDIAQAVQVRLAFVGATFNRDRPDFRVIVREGEP